MGCKHVRLLGNCSMHRCACICDWLLAAGVRAFFRTPLFLPRLQAYRAACHYGDSEEQVEESMRIASSAVYNKLMLFVLVRLFVPWREPACLGGEAGLARARHLLLGGFSLGVHRNWHRPPKSALSTFVLLFTSNHCRRRLTASSDAC